MAEHGSVRMELMSSKEVQAYLRKNDMIILPVGCFEMHGPDIPLGCDSFIAWAQSILLADVWGCLTLPPVFYTFPGASGPWPGTIDISTRVTQEYVSAIVRALLKNGFGRIVLSGGHGPLRFMLESVIRDLFQETGNIVIHLGPDGLLPSDVMEKEFGYPCGEDIMSLAALKILGLHGAYHPGTRGCDSTRPPFESLTKLKSYGAVVPWTFSRDYQHTGLRGEVKLDDASKAVKIMEQAAARMKDLPETFAQYQEDMKKLYADTPWNREDIWTETK
jgi:creatinine amidohydrolase/Fe(II)-dependent formamide hydrolase-like protein